MLKEAQVDRLLRLTLLFQSLHFFLVLCITLTVVVQAVIVTRQLSRIEDQILTNAVSIARKASEYYSASDKPPRYAEFEQSYTGRDAAQLLQSTASALDTLSQVNATLWNSLVTMFANRFSSIVNDVDQFASLSAHVSRLISVFNASGSV